MGRGASKAGGGSGGTPSGVTMQQFMQMSDQEKYDTMNDILDNKNIVVPDYLDGSDTTKIIYALGMNNKPDVVADDVLDTMAGRDIFRTVYETGSMPPPSTADVAEQIRIGDYTHMSGKGGSYHGRAIYFADNFDDSATYGSSERNPMVMRGKLKPTANIRSEGSLQRQMYNDSTFDNSRLNARLSGTDAMAVYAISKGIDGWYSGTYTMMVNRGATVMSSKNKRISMPGRNISSHSASNWTEAADV